MYQSARSNEMALLGVSARLIASCSCSLVLFFLTACVAGQQKYSSACVFNIGETSSDLRSLAGAEDAPGFEDYSFTSDAEGTIFAYDPVANRILRGSVRQDGCDVEAVLQLDDPAPLGAFTLVDDVFFGLSLDGVLFPVAHRIGNTIESFKPGRPGEAAREFQPYTRDYVEQLLGYEMPVLRDARGIWEPVPDVQRSPGELARTIEGNRHKVSRALPPIRNASNRDARYEVEVRSANTAEVNVYADASKQTKLATAQLQVPDYIGAVEVIALSPSNEITVAAESFGALSAGKIGLALLFAQYTSTGSLLAQSVVRFPLKQPKGAIPLDREFELDSRNPNDVRVAVKYDKKQEIIRIPLKRVTQSTPQTPSTLGSVARLRSPAREQLNEYRRGVLDRAEEFLTMKWTVSASSLGENAEASCAPPQSQWLLPVFLRGIPSGTVVYGTPYQWNGKGLAQQIHGDLKAGAIAGNVCCKQFKDKKSGDLIPTEHPGTTGIDCSGFVGRAWDLRDSKGRPIPAGTSTLPRYAQRVAKVDQLTPGDAFNLPGSHVRLFAGWVSTPMGLRARVYESTTASVCSGTCQQDVRLRGVYDYEMLQPLTH